jgi:hypothetical protein
MEVLGSTGRRAARVPDLRLEKGLFRLRLPGRVVGALLDHGQALHQLLTLRRQAEDLLLWSGIDAQTDQITWTFLIPQPGEYMRRETSCAQGIRSLSCEGHGR